MKEISRADDEGAIDRIYDLPDGGESFNRAIKRAKAALAACGRGTR